MVGVRLVGEEVVVGGQIVVVHNSHGVEVQRRCWLVLVLVLDERRR